MQKESLSNRQDSTGLSVHSQLPATALLPYCVPRAFLALPTTAPCASLPTPVQQVLTARVASPRYTGSPPEQRMLHRQGQGAASPASAPSPAVPAAELFCCKGLHPAPRTVHSPTWAAPKPLQKKIKHILPPNLPLIFFWGFFRGGTHWHSEAHRNKPCVRLSTEIILKVSRNLLFQVSS